MLQLGPDGWVASKDMEGIAKKTGSGISTSKQDVEDLGTDLDRIICGKSKLVHEDILLFGGLLVILYLPTRQTLAAKLKRLCNELINEVVDFYTSSVELLVAVQLYERPESHAEIQLRLGEVERLAE